MTELSFTDHIGTIIDNPTLYTTAVKPPLFSLGLFFVILILLLVILCCIPAIKRFITKHLKGIALCVWLSGFFVYVAGFNDGGSENNYLILCLRAALSAFEMFVSQSDLLEIPERLLDCDAYMYWFSVTHFLAVMVSAVFIIRILGLNVTSKITLLCYSLASFCKILFRRDLFVFWGINKNSIITAKSIAKEYNDRKQKACILFVNLNKTQHSHSFRYTFSHFFYTSSESVEQYISEIENIGALLVNANKPFTSASFANCKGTFKALGIRCVDNLRDNILHRGYNKVEYFFLSDNESENLSAIVALKAAYRDKDIGKSKDKDKDKDNQQNLRCYCHVRKNSFNTALLDCSGLRNNVYLVDSSSLAILPLKENVSNHPVSFVKSTKEGYVIDDFNALVIGFGEAGRDAFRFLYEFASFCDKNGNETPKTIYVADSQLHQLKADFLTAAPALKDKSSQIQWWDDISTHSASFWERLMSVINSLNYIVITVNNDEEALDIAIDIFEFAYRYRVDTRNFNIYVRLRNEEMYSSLTALESSCIIPFGSNNRVFHYKTISMDATEEGAMEFYYEYEKKKEEIEKTQTNIGQDKYLQWYNRRDANNDKDGLIYLRYSEEQDISNYRHIKTKRCLAGLSEDAPGNSVDIRLAKNSTLLTNLCRCEHLRWNAKMELLGFVYEDIEEEKGTKDLRRRKHRCLVSCHELETGQDNKAIVYDEIVVNLSFDRRFDMRK